MYASKARKDGFEQIASIFLETAENEREHASLFYKKLEGGKVEITADFPAGDIGTTLENLAYAAEGEHDEATMLYPEFARVAREEGFTDVAELFERISTIEAHHEKRYRDLYENVKNDRVFKREEEEEWVCRECGYVHKGTSAPDICPVCSHAQAFYQLHVDNF
jgi:rubrerythrin